MLEAITWKHYIIGIACVTFLWYVAIILLYYRKDLKEMITARSGKADSSYDELYDLVLEIRHSILEEAGKETTKQELLAQLKGRLVNYSGLRKPALQLALNNSLIQDAEEICGVSFSEVELKEAWNSLPR